MELHDEVQRLCKEFSCAQVVMNLRSVIGKLYRDNIDPDSKYNQVILRAAQHLYGAGQLLHKLKV
jgi:hypothetical protein